MDGNSIFGVALSADGNRVAFGGSSKKIKCFEVASGAELYSKPTSDRLRTVAISGAGDLVACGGFDGVVAVQPIDRGAQLNSIEMGDDVRSVALDSAGTRLAGWSQCRHSMEAILRH